MSNSKWQTPDIEGMLRERDALGDETLLPQYEQPLGISSSIPGVGSSDGQYVIDLDYAEILGLPFDAPFGYRR